MQNRISSVLADQTFVRQANKSGLLSQVDPATIHEVAPPVQLRPPQEALPPAGPLPNLEALPDLPTTSARTMGLTGQEEAIILLDARPALLIRRNRIQVPNSGLWVKPVMSRRTLLESRLGAVGRIEVDEGLSMGTRHMGTGWLIGEGVIATNRHVAETFAIKGRKGGDFKISFTRQPYRAQIDFLEEYQEREEFQIEVEKVLFMQDQDRQMPDIAFLKLRSHGRLPAPLPLCEAVPQLESDLALVGYPAYDPRYGLDSLAAAREIFGDIYNVKRFSPGKYKGSVEGAWYFMHDATTLGGNSGSPVFDLETGYVIGMHFQGEFRVMNYAVKAAELLRYARTNAVAVNEVKRMPTPTVYPDPEQPEPGEAEAPATNYANRKGYLESFLGQGFKATLPKLGASIRDQALVFAANKTRLDYHHFSVVMNQQRRLCFFSAVNIDGKKSVSIRGQRPRWRKDPRIPGDLQVISECYGAEQLGKFSRGHMTRREDPNWGSNAVAKEANWDTFHVTNACPQMQPFNAGVWNGLEDYALQNARQDDMKISVFTGPVFQDNDPVFFGVKVPVMFWKIIVFIHDQTGRLTATGYKMSQKDFLPGEEFVFGQYETYQTSLKDIEAMTQLSFGTLKSKDPLQTIEEAPARPLSSFEEVRFV